MYLTVQLDGHIRCEQGTDTLLINMCLKQNVQTPTHKTVFAQKATYCKVKA